VEENDCFESGDTVRLKIGGPLMTILAVSEEDCCCMWFSDRGTFEHGRFEHEVLERVKRAVRVVS
jgi:uncharacterized protein YodC (DUF2158 family)